MLSFSEDLKRLEIAEGLGQEEGQTDYVTTCWKKVKLFGDQFRPSATNLSNRLGCRHLTELKLAAASVKLKPPSSRALANSMRVREETLPGGETLSPAIILIAVLVDLHVPGVNGLAVEVSEASSVI